MSDARPPVSGARRPPSVSAVGRYDVGHLGLTEADVRRVVDLLGERPPRTPRRAGSAAPVDGLLGGRRPVLRVPLDGGGRGVVKRYARGGLLRSPFPGRFLRFPRLTSTRGPTTGAAAGRWWPASRPEAEFTMLSKVLESGIRVPEPLAFVTAGGLLYRGWLVTREVEGAVSLASVARSDPERLVRLSRVVGDQLSLLIRERVHHVDLHPGNVLVDDDDGVYLIDFDKAYRYTGDRNELRDTILRRWRRAVLKHGLPEVLTEMVCLRLRESFHDPLPAGR